MGASPPFGRLVRSADFQRALAVPPCSRSAHFALHHVRPGAAVPSGGAQSTGFKSLSTELCTTLPPVVDEGQPAVGLLGCLVPKRHARRSVTRQFFKRLIRAAAQARTAPLPAGLWLVRLRAPFPLASFPSARSEALGLAVRQELQQLWQRVEGRA